MYSRVIQQIFLCYPIKFSTMETATTIFSIFKLALPDTKPNSDENAGYYFYSRPSEDLIFRSYSLTSFFLRIPQHPRSKQILYQLDVVNFEIKREHTMIGPSSPVGSWAINV